MGDDVTMPPGLSQGVPQDLSRDLPLSLAEATKVITAPGAPYEVAEAEIHGIKTRIWKNTPNDLSAVLAASAGHGEAEFLIYQDERLTYGAHYRQACALARRLREDMGLAKGDRVALAMRNYPEWSIAFFAITAAGGVVVALNAWWSGEELEYGVADSGAEILICDRDRFDAIAPHRGKLPNLREIIVTRGADLPAGIRDFATACASDDEAALPEADIFPEDDATIFYSSGTTGLPKGVIGSHRNICSNIVAVGFIGARTDLTLGNMPAFLSGEKPPVGTSLLAVPFFHATGCHAALLAVVAAGNRLVLMHRWDPEQALALIERERVTGFTGVPGMVWQMLESPKLAEFDVSSLKSLGYGGAPAAPELVRNAGRRMPLATARNGYGMTETSSVVTFNGGPSHDANPDSVGTAIPVCELRIVDANGDDLPTGAVGELWMKGPNVVRGYWNKPDATAESFSQGWVHSGDLARLDEEGFLYIVDRLTDMLIRGGENIYCVEVEDALYAHPDIMDAAVFGTPHQILGEEVAAVVQRVPGSTLDLEALRAFLAAHIAGFKIPVAVEFRDQPLPRNAAGKILKRDLREEFVNS